ncbi:MAG: hemerythrin [Desulfuromonas sp.]|nr:MAG: hemerythrin [Desulfuromonas sp.]
MILFEWTEDYELKIPKIDDQHKELVKMINELYAALKSEHSSETVNVVLNRLLQYVEIHFETEEAAMRQNHYPDFDGHIYLHDLLREEVLELKKVQLQGGEVATFELLNFLTDWLKNHIAKADRAFGQYLVNQGRSLLV